MSKGTVLIADDDKAIRTVLVQALGRVGFDVKATGTASSLWKWVSNGEGDVIVTDVMMPDQNAFDLIPRIRRLRPDLPIIVISAKNTLTTAITAAERGAFEYLPKPFDLGELTGVVARAMELPRAQADMGETGGDEDQNLPLVGRSPAMQEIYRTVARLTQNDLSVLVTGDSGTGKELIARALHDYGRRRHGQFVALNMAAIPRELIESELFGHEKGAFTGASQRMAGRFAQAEGGTLFLDEIGDMPMETQTRLLRVLQEGEFTTVGGRQPIKTDVRIIAATHQDLEAKIAAGSFREDLYHRLNVINIALPPLRERQEDIPALASHFLQAAALEMGLEVKRFRPETIDRLRQMSWPGNIRQLQNLCQQLCVMAPGEQIFIEDLPPDTVSQAGSESVDGWPEHLRHWMRQSLRSGRPDLMAAAREQLERVALNCALEYTNGKRIEAARLLGLGRNTLTRKLKELEGVEADGV